MIISGRDIASAIQEELRSDIEASNKRPTLAIFAALTRLPEHKRLAIEKFVEKKKVFAEAIGVQVIEYELPETTEAAVQAIKESKEDGIVVQLPLPETLDTDMLCSAIPVRKDVDLLSLEAKELFSLGESKVLPPVVGAVAEIIARHNISLGNKRSVVVGKGALVGQPMATWLKQHGAEVTILDKSTQDTQALHRADIIVLGAGVSGLLTPDMVQDGVVVFDAGTSEAAGVLKGDADSAVAEKAALFTPVPGGIGPITVAVLFKNLCILSGLHHT